MISVIVPVYNIEEYLPQCIESIINQTYTELEVILVDDGSTDMSGNICDRYALRDLRIRVIHKENGGLVSARKAGVSVATGEYVGYVDGDDWIEPDTYQKLIDNGQGAEVVTFACYEEYGDYRILKENKVQEGLYTTRQEKERLYKTMFMNNNFYEFGVLPTLWSKLFRRELLITRQNKVSNVISYGEDVVCTFPCLLDAATVCVTNLPLYHYRQRRDSIVKGNVKVQRSSFIGIYRLLYEKSGASPMMKEQLQKQIHYYMWFILLGKAYGDLGKRTLLFPFSKICSGARIAIHGAGTFGRAVKEYCDNLSDIHVVGWSDLHYETCQKQGLNVISMEKLQRLEYDFIVIAILNESLAEEIKEVLVGRGVPEKKIDWVRKGVLKKAALPDWIISV